MKPSPTLLVRLIPRAALLARSPTPPQIQSLPTPSSSTPSTTAGADAIANTTTAAALASPDSGNSARRVHIVPAPPSFHELQRQRRTLIDIMTARQRDSEASGSWPANLRIEPIVTSKTLGSLVKGAKGRFKALLKER